MKNAILMLAAALATFGCGENSHPDYVQRYKMPTPTVAPNIPSAQARFKVIREQVVSDDIAAQGQRGVYVITDLQTGREYIGVSGVGVAETERIKRGKSSRDEDE